MGYYRDLEQISIQDFKQIIKSHDLLKSRMILKDHLDERMERIERLGVSNLQLLLNELKYKAKALEFAKKADLEEEYILILRREIKSYLPTPNTIYDFIIIPEKVKQKLIDNKINNTYELYEYIKTKHARSHFRDELNLTLEEVSLLTHLTDISRVRWVNHTFASILYQIGIDSLLKLQNIPYQDLYDQVNAYNQSKGIYKGKIGLHDMKLVVEEANLIDHDIEY